MYQSGNGVGKDFKKAVYWFKEAAEQGDSDAQNNLGIMYYCRDDGIEKDLEEARYWLEEAAAQGNEVARKNLENIYKINNTQNKCGSPHYKFFIFLQKTDP